MAGPRAVREKRGENMLLGLKRNFGKTHLWKLDQEKQFRPNSKRADAGSSLKKEKKKKEADLRNSRQSTIFFNRGA